MDSQNKPKIKKNTLRFNSSSNVDSQVQYAQKYLLSHKEGEDSYLLLQGTGVTTSKVVSAVERIKEFFRSHYDLELYQINKIGSIVFDEDNRCIKEDELPKPASSVVDKAINAGLRRVSCIEVIISINEIKSKDIGFQHEAKPAKSQKSRKVYQGSRRGYKKYRNPQYHSRCYGKYYDSGYYY
ncbi:unnamed protein product [Moneuplotes crassus]|uniref:DNA/RNA-binding protein Alba-like domain-containing protein n=1 Tax=Euplotes crassus TaxID=5936 RepID=A0AAD2D6D3_EUPCR|nr:unnamed protein product [Moneuplotes crassus]